VKTHETFSQLIVRLSGLNGLGWLSTHLCPDKDTAIETIGKHWHHCYDKGYYDLALQAVYARDEILDFEIETQDQHWRPTEQDYRECCGMWATRDGFDRKYYPNDLHGFDDRSDFDRFHRNWVRIEPVPEQCIPKQEPKRESYQIRFPLLAGAMT
jgi:hypothetical protein